jgi:hypothetical protein
MRLYVPGTPRQHAVTLRSAEVFFCLAQSE